MTPDQLAKSGSEHGEQRGLFAWLVVARHYGFQAAWDEASYREPGYVRRTYAWGDAATDAANPNSGPFGVPELEFIFAIPNGGLRDKITAAKLAHEGVKSGVPDIMFPQPCSTPKGMFAGLFIEMKREGNKEFKQAKGRTSSNQEKWIAHLRRVGYACSVCFTWQQAAKEIQSYVEAYQRPLQ